MHSRRVIHYAIVCVVVALGLFLYRCAYVSLLKISTGPTKAGDFSKSAVP